MVNCLKKSDAKFRYACVRLLADDFDNAADDFDYMDGFDYVDLFFRQIVCR